MKKVILVFLCCISLLGMNLTGIQAKEDKTEILCDFTSCLNASARGATDIYYEVIDYSITNKSKETYIGEVEFSSGFSLQVNLGFFTISYDFVATGKYKDYKYKADFTVYTRKVDAMGHYLGTQTFVNKGVTLHRYQRI